MKRTPQPATVDQALERLKLAAAYIANVIDGGERDPTSGETIELEQAAIAYGRAVRREAKR